MKTNREIIEVDEEIENFKDYLDEDANQRIIFSGIFGAGKTTFLRKFFKAHKSEYTVLHLFPTNYAVVSNEDIFRLIKYDLLYEIISHKPLLEEESVNLTDSIGTLDPNEQWQIIRSLIEAVPKIGKPVGVLIESLNNVIEVVKANKAKFDKSESSLIKDFIDDMELGNSLYENDAYTKLIIDLTKRLKEGGQKVILVIDDLDRIDPDHIFRILNVFAVHFDVSGRNYSSVPSNKFDLDKVILVCDIENIRSIFRHRYGVSTDFNGYIDKFYSSGIYEFDIKRKLVASVRNIISSVEYSKEAGNLISLFNGESFTSKGLESLLISMILSDRINTREFIKFDNQSYKLPVYILLTHNGDDFYNWQFPAVTIFDFLRVKLGGFNKVHEILESCYISIPDKPEVLRVLEANLFFLLQFKGSFNVNSNAFSIRYRADDSSIGIKILRQSNEVGEIFNCSYTSGDVFHRERFKDTLILAFEFYRVLYESRLKLDGNFI